MSEQSPSAPSQPPFPTPGHEPQTIRCAGCGYDISAQPIGSVCPECGTRIAQRVVGNQSQGKAIAALVLGICSIPGCFFYGVPGIICGVIAIVLAGKAQVAVQDGSAPVSSSGLATGGKVCGIIGLSLSAIYLLFMVIVIAFALLSNP